MITQHTSGFLRLVEKIKPQIIEIDVNTLANKLFSTSFYFLIDVRETEECKQGIIPGSIHLSKGIIERDIEKIVPDYAANIVVYCSGGFRSSLVADNLKKMGYQCVYSLMGGLKAWLEAGHSLVAMPVNF